MPEDRKRQGLVLSMDVLNNATLSILPRLARLGFITRGGEREAAQGYFDRLRVKSPRLDTLVAALSGGNQQKIVLTKWLAARCPILILDEPTRGVDVGAKAEIHALIDELAAAGNARHPHLERDAGGAAPLDAHPRLPRRPHRRRALPRRGQSGVTDAADGGRGRVSQGSEHQRVSHEVTMARSTR